MSTWALLENWKTAEYESDVYTNYEWYSWYSHQMIIKGTGGLGNNSIAISIIVGVLGTVSKSSKRKLVELEIKDKIKTIQITEL